MKHQRLDSTIKSVINQQAYAIAVSRQVELRIDLEAWAWDLVAQGKSLGEVVDLIRQDGDRHVRQLVSAPIPRLPTTRT